MGSALAEVISKKAGYELLICDKDAKREKEIAAAIGGRAAKAQTVARECDYIFIAVKPYAVGELLEGIGKELSENSEAVIISMAAAVSIGAIEAHLPAKMAVIRIMPNTPVKVGEGVVAFSKNKFTTERDTEYFLDFMSGCGIVEELPEGLIDAESALAGCGPAFAYMFIEALSDGAVRCGLPRAQAIEYAAATLKGAAEMVLTTGSHPGALKDAVCSPGGSTIEGVLTLEAGGFRSSAAEAVVAAYEKTKKMC